VGVPIIAPDLLVVVRGDSVPKLEMKADRTIYLLK
jgi:hypothetical protein